MKTETVKQTETVNRDFVKVRKIRAKVARLANMKASYKFRLAAIAASDNRPGKVWETTRTAAERELSQYMENRQTIGAW